MDPRERLTEVCLSLPEAEATAEGRHVGFTVRRKRFAWLLEDHHGDGRIALNCKAPPGENAALAAAEPDALFVPAYLGARGWVGVWLDTPHVDWERVEGLVVDSYRMTAPKRLAARLDS
jgi:phosphoribosylglycinamide formyltransferase-1